MKAAKGMSILSQWMHRKMRTVLEKPIFTLGHVNKFMTHVAAIDPNSVRHLNV